MYPRQRDFSKRKVHKAGKGRTGSMAELHDLLVGRGYSYQYEAGQPSYHDIGKAIYKNSQNNLIMIKRIARGAEAKWLPKPEGATSWLARTAAQPDVWQMFRKKRRS